MPYDILATHWDLYFILSTVWQLISPCIVYFMFCYTFKFSQYTPIWKCRCQCSLLSKIVVSKGINILLYTFFFQLFYYQSFVHRFKIIFRHSKPGLWSKIFCFIFFSYIYQSNTKNSVFNRKKFKKLISSLNSILLVNIDVGEKLQLLLLLLFFINFFSFFFHFFSFQTIVFWTDLASIIKYCQIVLKCLFFPAKFKKKLNIFFFIFSCYRLTIFVNRIFNCYVK